MYQILFLLIFLGAAVAPRPRLIFIDEEGVPQCPCARILLPVCGSDGRTYNNECLLRCQQNLSPGIRSLYPGNCRRSRSTYEDAISTNLAEAPKEGLNLRFNLAEDKKNDTDTNCTCPGVFNLTVCGKDGVTYINECKARCAGTIPRSIGRCPDPSKTYNGTAPCHCNHIPPSPVCGRDGDYLASFSNPCTLNCHIATVAPNMTFYHSGYCEERQPPRGPCGCSRDNQMPFCGTDGVTYFSLCELNCLVYDKGVRPKHAGECKEKNYLLKKKRSCECDGKNKLVCGTDGVTYTSLCHLKCKSKSGTGVQHKGPCDGMKTFLENMLNVKFSKIHGNKWSLKDQ